MLGFLLMIILPIIAIVMYNKMAHKENGAFKFFVGLIASVFLVIIGFIIYAITAPQPKPEYRDTSAYSSPQFNYYEEMAHLQRAESIAKYYQEHYPMVWGYIKKNADSPYDYVVFYDNVWGDMHEYTGDGINFDTLTRYEQSLVNYPRIGSYVYFSSSKSKEYHSTTMCYSLLKSDPVSRPASQRYSYNPCSKCVGN